PVDLVREPGGPVGGRRVGGGNGGRHRLGRRTGRHAQEGRRRDVGDRQRGGRRRGLVAVADGQLDGGGLGPVAQAEGRQSGGGEGGVGPGRVGRAVAVHVPGVTQLR